MRRTRTFLAVPAHRASMVKGAAASQADAVFMDLEDSVPPEQKGEALGGALQALHQLDWGGKTVCVRTNVVGSATFEQEVRALAGEPRLDTFLLPKVEHEAQLRSAHEIAAPVARDRGHACPGLEALIETAGGLVAVDSLAATQGVGLEALHFGVGDFAASIGARTWDVGQSPPMYRHGDFDEHGSFESVALDLWAYPMMRVLVAARAFGLRAIDGPCGAFRDAIRTEASARKASAMGFDGKQVIHPSQIAATRLAFEPGPAEVADAQAVIAASAEASAQKLGAVQLGGRMIDEANVRMARRILLLAGIDPSPSLFPTATAVYP
ncbi:CoA ester lyase [Xylophilus rhododendri]|uniref:CoA ester lyase n=1 Tax=Xylophilus rhododendri TaxID=2697032 RepID=A0A857J7I0_9BURK|nr:CoA ester lyase [Xylophilus rhododendri]QHI98745.1 CoA ester lyase [Xylophilus rhododendri]